MVEIMCGDELTIVRGINIFCLPSVRCTARAKRRGKPPVLRVVRFVGLFSLLLKNLHDVVAEGAPAVWNLAGRKVIPAVDVAYRLAEPVVRPQVVHPLDGVEHVDDFWGEP